jgi:hypothetical protein
MDSLTAVEIDFAASHLVFPRLVGAALGLMALAILVRRRRAITGARGYWKAQWAEMDRPRLLGSLGLMLVYFLSMVPVGDLWPNTGMGFLLCSVPFVFASGLLFMHDRVARPIAILGVVALAAPTLVWWIFTDLFFLTLP